MKIFLTFFNGIKNGKDKYAIPLFYEAFINGLKDNGNDVFTYIHKNWNLQGDNIPLDLLNKIKNFNPDLILIFNNKFYDISTYFECPIAIYEVDSPLYYGNKDKLKANPNRYKYFVPSTNSIDILRNDFGVDKKNILLVPFFTEIRAKNSENLFNICFIGSRFTNSYRNCFNSFMDSNPSDVERKKYLELLNKYIENVFVSKEELFDVEISNNIVKNFNMYSICFAMSDYTRIKVLSNIADLGLDIWGTPNWASENYNEPYLVLNYHKEPIYTLADNEFVYNSSKIGINIGHLQAKGGFPWRVFDIMASNSCLVTEYYDDFSKYFPKLKLPYFSNVWEAREQCKKLLADENYRKDIVLQSQEIVNKNHRFINVLCEIENYLEINLKNDKVGSVIMDFEEIVTKTSKKLSFKNKIRYKIWSHYNKKLKQKGII